MTKVEESPGGTVTFGDEVARPIGSDGARVARPAPSRKRAEDRLHERHMGTYGFYNQLPGRSREGSFVDHGNAASIEALRARVVDRYLHP